MNINLTLLMQAVAFFVFILLLCEIHLAAADAGHRNPPEADRRRAGGG